MVRRDLRTRLAARRKPGLIVFHQRFDCHGKCRWVFRCDEPAAIAYDIPDAGTVFRQNRASLCLRFKIDHTESLADTGPQETIGAGKVFRQLLWRKRPQKCNPVTECRKQRFNLRPPRPVSDDRQRPAVRSHKSERGAQRRITVQLVAITKHRAGEKPDWTAIRVAVPGSLQNFLVQERPEPSSVRVSALHRLAVDASRSVRNAFDAV